MQAHPSIVFRDGLAGRRAALAGGPEVADVIGAIIDGDVPPDQRRSRAAELLGLAERSVDDALAYYADHTEEVDEQIATRTELAQQFESRWRRQQALLGR